MSEFLSVSPTVHTTFKTKPLGVPTQDQSWRRCRRSRSGHPRCRSRGPNAGRCRWRSWRGAADLDAGLVELALIAEAAADGVLADLAAVEQVGPALGAVAEVLVAGDHGRVKPTAKMKPPRLGDEYLMLVLLSRPEW